MNYKFKIGDKVRHSTYGKGIVKTIDFDDPILCYAVEFDKANDDLHDCSGHTHDIHGWWCKEDEIYPISDSNLITCYPDIHVSFNINKGITTAKFISPEGKTLKACIAKCDSYDAWDSYVGANIAIARLFNKDPQWDAWDEEYDMGDTVEWDTQVNGSGKFVCISAGYGNGKRIFTKGKIYEFKDYTMRDDCGTLVLTNTPEFENYFLKIVE